MKATFAPRVVAFLLSLSLAFPYSAFASFDFAQDKLRARSAGLEEETHITRQIKAALEEFQEADTPDTALQIVTTPLARAMRLSGLEERVAGPDEKTIAELSGEAVLLHLSGRDQPVRLQAYSGKISSVVFSPDGRRLIAKSDRPGYLRVWDLTGLAVGGKAEFLWAHSVSKDQPVGFNPEGTEVIVETLGYRGHKDRFNALTGRFTGRAVSAGLEEDGTALHQAFVALVEKAQGNKPHEAMDRKPDGSQTGFIHLGGDPNDFSNAAGVLHFLDPATSQFYIGYFSGGVVQRKLVIETPYLDPSIKDGILDQVVHRWVAAVPPLSTAVTDPPDFAPILERAPELLRAAGLEEEIYVLSIVSSPHLLMTGERPDSPYESHVGEGDVFRIAVPHSSFNFTQEGQEVYLVRVNGDRTLSVLRKSWGDFEEWHGSSHFQMRLKVDWDNRRQGSDPIPLSGFRSGKPPEVSLTGDYLLVAYDETAPSFAVNTVNRVHPMGPGFWTEDENPWMGSGLEEAKTIQSDTRVPAGSLLMFQGVLAVAAEERQPNGPAKIHLLGNGHGDLSTLTVNPWDILKYTFIPPDEARDLALPGQGKPVASERDLKVGDLLIPNLELLAIRGVVTDIKPSQIGNNFSIEIQPVDGNGNRISNSKWFWLSHLQRHGALVVPAPAPTDAGAEEIMPEIPQLEIVGEVPKLSRGYKNLLPVDSQNPEAAVLGFLSQNPSGEGALLRHVVRITRFPKSGDLRMAVLSLDAGDFEGPQNIAPGQRIAIRARWNDHLIANPVTGTDLSFSDGSSLHVATGPNYGGPSGIFVVLSHPGKQQRLPESGILTLRPAGLEEVVASAWMVQHGDYLSVDATNNTGPEARQRVIASGGKHWTLNPASVGSYAAQGGLNPYLDKVDPALEGEPLLRALQNELFQEHLPHLELSLELAPTDVYPFQVELAGEGKALWVLQDVSSREYLLRPEFAKIIGKPTLPADISSGLPVPTQPLPEDQAKALHDIMVRNWFIQALEFARLGAQAAGIPLTTRFDEVSDISGHATVKVGNTATLEPWLGQWGRRVGVDVYHTLAVLGISRNFTLGFTQEDADQAISANWVASREVNAVGDLDLTAEAQTVLERLSRVQLPSEDEIETAIGLTVFPGRGRYYHSHFASRVGVRVAEPEFNGDFTEEARPWFDLVDMLYVLLTRFNDELPEVKRHGMVMIPASLGTKFPGQKKYHYLLWFFGAGRQVMPTAPQEVVDSFNEYAKGFTSAQMAGIHARLAHAKRSYAQAVAQLSSTDVEGKFEAVVEAIATLLGRKEGLGTKNKARRVVREILIFTVKKDHPNRYIKLYSVLYPQGDQKFIFPHLQGTRQVNLAKQTQSARLEEAARRLRAYLRAHHLRFELLEDRRIYIRYERTPDDVWAEGSVNLLPLNEPKTLAKWGLKDLEPLGMDDDGNGILLYDSRGKIYKGLLSQTAGMEEGRVAGPELLREGINLLPQVTVGVGVGVIAAGLEDEAGLAYGVAVYKRGRTDTGKAVPVVFLTKNEFQTAGLEELGVSPEVIFQVGTARYPTLARGLEEATRYLQQGLGVARVVLLGLFEKVSLVVEEFLDNLSGTLPDPYAAVQWKDQVEALVNYFRQA